MNRFGVVDNYHMPKWDHEMHSWLLCTVITYIFENIYENYIAQIFDQSLRENLCIKQ